MLFLRGTGFEMLMPNPTAGMSYDPIGDICLQVLIEQYSSSKVSIEVFRTAGKNLETLSAQSLLMLPRMEVYSSGHWSVNCICDCVLS